MAAKMSSMQSASQASELTIKNVKDVIALHERRSENDTAFDSGLAETLTDSKNSQVTVAINLPH